MGSYRGHGHATRVLVVLVGATLAILAGCSGSDEPAKPVEPAGPQGPLVTGSVVDPHGVPVAGLSVSAGDCATCADTTDGMGDFRLRLALGTAKYVLSVRDETTPDSVGSWYDFVTDSLAVAATNLHRVVMIPNVAICGVCYDYWQPPDDRHFLEFFKTLTITRPYGPLHYLKRMDCALPLKYWADPVPNPYGHDVRAIAEEVAQAWQARTGLPLFTEVADSNQADLLINYDPLDGRTLGLTISVDPPERWPASVNPHRVRCLIGEGLQDRGMIRGVTLHEVGHALGLWRHSECTCHVMTDGGIGEVPDGTTLSSLISEDEALAANVIRRLPPDFDMNWYKDD